MKTMAIAAILCAALVVAVGAYAFLADSEEGGNGPVVTTDGTQMDDVTESGSEDSGSATSGGSDDAQTTDSGAQTTDDSSSTKTDGSQDADSGSSSQEDDAKTTDDDTQTTDDSSSTQKDDTSTADDGSTTVFTIGSLTLTYVEGDACHAVTGSDGETVITFGAASSDTEVSLTGTLTGSIVIDIGDDYDFILDLEGVTITSYVSAPIDAESADDLTISAKKGTSNYIYDNRDAVTDDDAISSAVYATMDLDVQGKGSLTVVSTSNNGIHSKDDLTVKNLTLTVTCQDNALKGNDSVTVLSGTVTLTASAGDGIKTTNTDLKTKDDGTTKQLGNVYIDTDKGDLTLEIYAANDGIDAAYGVYIDETEGNTLVVSIFTGAYSGTTASTTTGSDTVAAAAGWGGRGQPGGGDPFGPGGGNGDWRNGDGSDYSDTNTESRKGIKGDYLVEISGGTVTVMASDDSIHSNGYVTVSGGTLSLTTGDDGIHADGALAVSGGTVVVSTCYEGLEGDTVSISGGDISVVSDDDGVNSTGSSGTGIAISGGELYVYSGGDSLDSNSYTSYQGVVISDGYVVLISNGASDTAIDTERGYTYTGGHVLGISQGGGMSSENTYCSNFSSVGKSASLSASKGSYLTVTVGGTVVVSVLMPTSISNASAVYLGSSSATVSTSSSSAGTADSDGVYWRERRWGSSTASWTLRPPPSTRRPSPSAWRSRWSSGRSSPWCTGTAPSTPGA